MKPQISRFRSLLTVLPVLAAFSVSAAAHAQTAQKPQEITVVLTLPNKSPHDCKIEKIKVTSSWFSVECAPKNTHGGDDVKRYAYSLRLPGAHVFLDSIHEARAQNKRVSIEFETDTKKNFEGCPKKECRNIVSLTW